MSDLIMGSGEISRHLIKSINRKGSMVYVLNDPGFVESYSGHNTDVIYSFYTGSLMDDLQRAKIATVDRFIACSENDNRNAMAAQIALRIFHVPWVICHIGNESKADIYKGMGINVVSSTAMVSDTVFLSLENS